MAITSIKGFRDVLPEEAARRHDILTTARRVLEAYGYGEIELPLLEKVELFSRSVGATSDIVEKEMYAFEDRDGSIVALRPEGTASVVRAYIEGGLPRSLPVARLHYSGPMFRRERPQKGRYRQFTQIGAELLGRDDPGADAETLCLVADICTAIGVSGMRIEINSLGDAACRPAYRDALAEYGRGRIEQLCEDCKARLDRNPLRLLDCKQECCRVAMAEAPMMIDRLCDPCRAHHDEVLRLLAAAGVEVHANPRMVRGLDYYCRTAFEVVASGLGSQDAVGGGGRYDGLVRALGGPDVPGIGFAFGVERLELASREAARPPSPPRILIAPIGDEAAPASLALARRLRQTGTRVEVESARRRLKAQMQRADKLGVRFVVIVGETELAQGRATVRDLHAQKDHPSLFALDDDALAIQAVLTGIDEVA
ncbi:MAG TPA: histidine--tRNA ligase [Candidatus Limnocylindrales bacterium]|nr:histidine--tRNA ligase [Candidatus Limnocylindrales bacterium]